ncbi:ABC transporter substrate-binding protein [Butyrivibrio sp. XPD2002]|uniref:ABC transporter substrate-binding protein n=2 Tax=unclassified Butyrivibrio TaxID=2639466 RepID=UPI00041CDEDD|nr:ABC transporter substrate-binding protein [Butyrivibrio sp. XPD2002]
MRKSFKTLLSLGMATMLLLPGCGNGKKEEAAFVPKYDKDTEFSLTVAGSYGNFESLEAEFERFYEYYPNANLEYVTMDDYNNVISSALVNNEPPDIFTTSSWMVGNEMYDAMFDACEVLSDSSSGIDYSCIRESLIRTTDSGDVVMLPIFTTSYGMLVNMDIFEKEGLKVPTNFKELMEVCTKLKNAGYESPMMGADRFSGSGLFNCFVYPMFAYNVTKNSDKIDALNNFEPSSGELMRPALERLNEFVNSDCIDVAKCQEEIVDEYDSVIMRFFEGDVPMMFATGDVVSGTAKRESKSDAFTANPFKYKFFTAPAGDDGGYFINSISICFSVNKNSRNIDMANEFMRFLISKKELGNMAGLKRLIPPVDDFSSDEIYSALADIPADRSFSDKETGLLDPAVRQFRAAIYAVGNGEMTVDEAVAAYGSIPEE